MILITNMVTSFFSFMDAAHYHGPRYLRWTIDCLPITNRSRIRNSSRPSVIRFEKKNLSWRLSFSSIPSAALVDRGLNRPIDLRKTLIVTAIYDKEPDSSGEEDEGVDESENQEEGSLGRHGGHTARNGLASATLPVRVTSRLSVTRTSSPHHRNNNNKKHLQYTIFSQQQQPSTLADRSPNWS